MFKTMWGGYIINRYVDSENSNRECGKETTSETCNTQKCYVECSSTTTSYDCKKYDSWDTYCKKQYYKIDKITGKECERWWSEESCPCSEGGSSGGSSGGSGITCIAKTERNVSNGGYCDCSEYIGNSNYQGVYVKQWVDSNGDTRCCCGN